MKLVIYIVNCTKFAGITTMLSRLQPGNKTGYPWVPEYGSDPGTHSEH